MNILSVNIRGMGSKDNADWLRGIKESLGVSVLALQETQFKDLSEFNISMYWGNSSFGSDFVEADGRLGGILCMWDESVFQCTSTNVVMKRNLWESIETVKNNTPGWWVILGDFNSVRFRNERKNSKFNPTSDNNLNNFIFSADVREYSMRGRCFTCYTKKGNKQSKINRILLCNDFFSKWPEACLRALPRLHSDHSPLLLTVVNKCYGPKPFRVFDSWFDREGFKEEVSKAIESFNGEGLPDVLCSKLKHIRGIIKKWRDKTIFKEKEKKKTLQNEMEDLDMIAESIDLNEQELWVYTECKKELEEIGMLANLKQRSRIR
ncbi:uncharacterized protein LOC110932091 [Helianthus annuus]|uniref:uncharacterized protein LOC110932091 n=1 Tax=Helianthus annuus TaxID=4232 RepID=UPI000B8FB6C1|nr:uncharacterized protein LOC110932091 [Helianthus annuus]